MLITLAVAKLASRLWVVVVSILVCLSVIDANPFWPEVVSTTSLVNLMFNSIKMAMATNLYQ